MAQLGIVIRADGTLPFDDDFHPDHQRLVLGHLIQTGHTLEQVQETGAWKIIAGPLLPEAATE